MSSTVINGKKSSSGSNSATITPASTPVTSVSNMTNGQTSTQTSPPPNNAPKYGNGNRALAEPAATGGRFVRQNFQKQERKGFKKSSPPAKDVVDQRITPLKRFDCGNRFEMKPTMGSWPCVPRYPVQPQGPKVCPSWPLETVRFAPPASNSMYYRPNVDYSPPTHNTSTTDVDSRSDYSRRSSNTDSNNNYLAKTTRTLVPNRIFVGGISANTTEAELLALFSQYGQVKAAKIIQDRAGVSKGYGFITFESEDDARRLQRESDNIVLRERKLNIAPAIKKQPFSRAFDAASPPAVAPGNPQYFFQPSAVPFYQSGVTYYPPQPAAPGDPSAQQPVYQSPSVYQPPSGPPQSAAYQPVMFPAQPIYVPPQYTIPVPYEYNYYANNGPQYMVGGQGGSQPQISAMQRPGSPPRPPCYGQQLPYNTDAMYYNLPVYGPIDPPPVYQDALEITNAEEQQQSSYNNEINDLNTINGPQSQAAEGAPQEHTQSAQYLENQYPADSSTSAPEAPQHINGNYVHHPNYHGRPTHHHTRENGYAFAHDQHSGHNMAQRNDNRGFYVHGSSYNHDYLYHYNGGYSKGRGANQYRGTRRNNASSQKAPAEAENVHSGASNASSDSTNANSRSRRTNRQFKKSPFENKNINNNVDEVIEKFDGLKL